MANTFQGEFPHHNTRLDGWERTSPVGSYPANDYGLVDMIGNVWEWTDSWYGPHGTQLSGAGSVDATSQHGAVPRKTTKGGSYLCAPGYCRRYRPAARMAQGIDTTTGHLGFRCVIRPGDQAEP